MESSAHSEREMREATLIQAFKMFDRDGDNSISNAEFKTVMGSMVEKTQESEIQKMFDQADQDGDGSINFDEFANLLLAPE